MTLTADISATVKDKQRVKIKKGSKVKLISDHDNVVIVEYDGIRFPVNKKFVQ